MEGGRDRICRKGREGWYRGWEGWDRRRGEGVERKDRRGLRGGGG